MKGSLDFCSYCSRYAVAACAIQYAFIVLVFPLPLGIPRIHPWLHPPPTMQCHQDKKVTIHMHKKHMSEIVRVIGIINKGDERISYCWNPIP